MISHQGYQTKPTSCKIVTNHRSMRRCRATRHGSNFDVGGSRSFIHHREQVSELEERPQLKNPPYLISDLDD